MKEILKISNIVLFLLAGLFAFSTAAMAQDPGLQRVAVEKAEKNRRNRAALDETIESSGTVKALHERLSKADEEGFKKALSEVVAAKDRSVVPYLKARLALYSDSAFYIEVSLMRLGEKDYFDKAVAELSSDDPAIRTYAVWKLSLAKTKEAYRKLYELLDDERVRDDDPDDDMLIQSLSDVVKDRLASTEEDVPKGKSARDTAAWKDWFVQKHLID